MYCLIRGGLVVKRAITYINPEQPGDRCKFHKGAKLGQPFPTRPCCAECRDTGLVLAPMVVARDVEEACLLLVDGETYQRWSRLNILASVTDLQRRMLLARAAKLDGIVIPTLTLELEQVCACSKEA